MLSNRETRKWFQVLRVKYETKNQDEMVVRVINSFEMFIMQKEKREDEEGKKQYSPSYK